MNAPARYTQDVLDRITLRNLHHIARESADSWITQAACRGHNPDMWFPVGIKGKYALQHPNPDVQRAKTVCDACPVKVACLQFALNFERGRGTRHGIWGGMTEEQRDTLVRHLRRKRHHQ